MNHEPDRNARPSPIVLLFVLLSSQLGLAAGKLPQVLSDHMILQRNAAVSIWGQADAGEKVIVTFAGQSRIATADRNGRWLVKLDAMPASAEPRELIITGGSSSIKIADVLVGDVWLAGGQSNMGSPLNSAHNATEVLPKAQDPSLRFFRVKTKTAAEPQADCTGKWEASTPEAAKNFSAVAYFFAEDIRRDHQRPGISCRREVHELPGGRRPERRVQSRDSGLCRRNQEYRRALTVG